MGSGYTGFMWSALNKITPTNDPRCQEMIIEHGQIRNLNKENATGLFYRLLAVSVLSCSLQRLEWMFSMVCFLNSVNPRAVDWTFVRFINSGGPFGLLLSSPQCSPGVKVKIIHAASCKTKKVKLKKA